MTKPGNIKLTLRQHPAIEIEPNRILCNDVVFAHEFNPHGIKLYCIGHEFGPICCLWASGIEDALDEMADLGFAEPFSVPETDDGSEDDPEITRIGNFGHPHDLSTMWFDEVVLDSARDTVVLLKLAEARGQSATSLE